MKIITQPNATSRKHTNNWYEISCKESNKEAAEVVMGKIKEVYGHEFCYGEECTDEGRFYCSFVIEADHCTTKRVQLKHLKSFIG